MNFYQLLYGIHSEHGKKFTAGDIVKSKSELVAKFGSNKFRRLNDDEVSQLQTDEPKAGDEPDTAEQPKRVKHHKRKSA